MDRADLYASALDDLENSELETLETLENIEAAYYEAEIEAAALAAEYAYIFSE